MCLQRFYLFLELTIDTKFQVIMTSFRTLSHGIQLTGHCLWSHGMQQTEH